MGTRQRPGATRVIAMLASSLSLGACSVTYTLDSAIPQDQVIFDSTLLGTWMAPDSLRAVVTPKDIERYLFHFADDDGSQDFFFFGILGRLGEATVLEIWPATESEIEDWPLTRMQLVLEIAPDSIVIRGFDTDSIRSALKSGRLDVPHLELSHDMGGDLILGAPTADLAWALTEQLGRPGTLLGPTVWRRASGR